MSVVDVSEVADKSLLLVDDDRPFLNRLARAMEARGFELHTAESVGDGIEYVRSSPPAFAVVDMRLEDGTGLDVVEDLHNARHEDRVIDLPRYGSTATAVSSLKRCVIDYPA